MKKIIALFLVFMLCLSLLGCGKSDAAKAVDQMIADLGSITLESEEAIIAAETTYSALTEEQKDELDNYALLVSARITLDKLKTENTPEVVRLQLGETASTDLIDFTLDNCEFTYYVSNVVDSNFIMPTQEPNTIYGASVGNCLVSMTYTFTSKDRGGSISFGRYWDDWDPKWKVIYDGEEYQIKGFDLNDNKGDEYGNIAPHYVVSSTAYGALTGDSISNNCLLFAGETSTIRSFGVVNFEPQNLTDRFDCRIGVLNSKGELEYFTYEIPKR